MGINRRRSALLGALIVTTLAFNLGAASASVTAAGPITASLHTRFAGGDFSQVQFRLHGQTVTYTCKNPTESDVSTSTSLSTVWSSNYCTAPGNAVKALKVDLQINFVSGVDDIFIYSGTHRLTCIGGLTENFSSSSAGFTQIWSKSACLSYPR